MRVILTESYKRPTKYIAVIVPCTHKAGGDTARVSTRMQDAIAVLSEHEEG